MLRAESNIGTPKHNKEIPLDLYTNDFYISDNQKEYFNINNKLFLVLKFFNSSKSVSLFPIRDVCLVGNNFYLCYNKIPIPPIPAIFIAIIIMIIYLFY